MKKQTVAQIYEEQQMNQHIFPKEKAQQAISTPEQQEAQKIIHTLKQALMESQQAFARHRLHFLWIQG